MKRVETPEFSIEAHPMFENARVFAGSIGLRREPETSFSPRMSVWTADAKKNASPQDWLTDALIKDASPIVERRPVAFAGMAGEIAKVKDCLEDWETNEKREWYRLRALLVSGDGATWYHATAMASGADLREIEADFARMLDSIQVRLAGEAAGKARETGGKEQAAMLARLKKKIDEAAVAYGKREQALEDAARAARARAPAPDVEARFDEAVAAAGLRDKREILRKIMLPAVGLTEAGPAAAGKIGASRIGGGPDLPRDMAWPRDASGFYLNFLAQIDLADLPERVEPLPEAGLLSFFTGADYSDWRVLHTPPGTELVAHALPADAQDLTEAAFRMVAWDSDRKRFVADGTSVDGLSVETDETGRMAFARDGQPVMAFASEYEISRSAQALRLERSLSAPLGLSGAGNPDSYAEAGIEDPSDFALAVGERLRIGDGPQHQMFGVCGVRGLSSIRKLAADHAARQGWRDVATPDGWFVLLKLASGGEADFSFSDHGDYVFMAHHQDTAKGDFSRVFAFVESG